MHATRPKGGLGIHYKFAYWPREMYKFVFLNVKNLFSSQEAIFCSFTSTVACIRLLKILLKFSVAKSTLFPLHISEEKENVQIRVVVSLYLISIQHVQ